MRIKNKTNKRITFPVLEFSIGAKEEKEVNDNIADKVLMYQDIDRVEKKVEPVRVEKKVEKKEDRFKTNDKDKK